MKKLLAVILCLSLALSCAAVAVADEISFSWWGGDSRHEATQAAVAAFEAAEGATVKTHYAAWSGWEETMAQAFTAGNAEDVDMVNWNWLFSFVDGSGESYFLDLNEVADVIDLSQWSDAMLSACTVNGKLLAVPNALTGRIFYWNKTTFDQAGIEFPTTFAGLIEAGQIFQEKLGDGYYPLALGAYDKMILMVYMLESKYGKAWVEDGALNYSVEEIAEGIQLIQDLEDAHAIPTAATLAGDGADSLDKNDKWITGKYAGVWEWDTSASKCQNALAEGQEFVVGEELTDLGEYQGGFTKVAHAFAISKNSQNVELAAKLIDFLSNQDEGIRAKKSEYGIPASAKGLELCTAEGLIDPTVAEANAKILAWCSFPLDPTFEDGALKNTDGVYQDVFDGLSYEDYSVEEAAQVLADGINAVLSK
ncbi:MAG: carbohydrate ABC transporter substrate-binding protein [Clostridia bacterium]|nr:carbohydrate ABC transporter substrate-binding protein [Clostridia bacterium]